LLIDRAKTPARGRAPCYEADREGFVEDVDFRVWV